MGQAHFEAGEKQALAAGQLLKKAVVSSLAVGGVANHRAGYVLQMATDLVRASGQGFEFKQGVKAGWMAVDPPAQFGHGQAPVAREGVLRLAGVIVAELAVVEAAAASVVDRAGQEKCDGRAARRVCGSRAGARRDKAREALLSRLLVPGRQFPVAATCVHSDVVPLSGTAGAG